MGVFVIMTCTTKEYRMCQENIEIKVGWAFNGL